MKALIFPNDPLIEYVKKGEIKKNYFNPDHLYSEIHFVTFTDKECSIDEIQTTIGKAKGYIHVFSPLKLKDYLFPQKRVKEIMKNIRQYEFDIVRAYNPFFIGYMAVCIGKYLQCTSTISIHTDIKSIKKYYQEPLKALKYSFLTYYEYLSYKKTDNIIGVSHSSLNSVPQRYGTKTQVLNNTIDNHYFHPIKDSKKQYDLIMVGRIEKPKRQDIVLKAVKKTKLPLKVLLVGKGIGKSKLMKYSRKNNLNVQFIDSIPNEKLGVYYNQSRICVQISDYEGFGIPLLEAIKCEIPCVCSDISSFREIGGTVPMYIKKNNPEDLKKQLELYFKK